MNYIDLFSGIGGFALGAYWAGMKFDKHYFSEVEPYAAELYQQRFPEAIPLGDITKIKWEDLTDAEYIITGGFPCQDISIAGKGEGISGKRSGLWSEMFKSIRILRPRFAIIENVGAITIRGLDTVLGCLAEIGYDAEWQDIRASDMGAPHRRERIWIVAYPKQSCNRMYPRALGRTKTMVQTEKEQLQSGFKIGNSSIEMADTPGQRLQGEESTGGNRREQELFAKRCRWELEPNVGRLAHGVSNKMDRLKGLGNSIVPQIAELLFRQIKDMVYETSTSL